MDPRDGMADADSGLAGLDMDWIWQEDVVRPYARMPAGSPSKPRAGRVTGPTKRASFICCSFGGWEGGRPCHPRSRQGLRCTGDGSPIAWPRAACAVGPTGGREALDKPAPQAGPTSHPHPESPVVPGLLV